MNDLSQIISNEIKKRYKSVKKFSEEIGIPQTTIVSAVKNGIKGTAYDTVIRICEKLDIEIIGHHSHIVMTDDVINLLNMFTALDEKGAHAVMAFTAMEFNRSKGNDDYIEQAIAKSHEMAQRKIADFESDKPAEPVIVS